MNDAVEKHGHHKHEKHCLNCGVVLTSLFCADCGQPAVTSRYTAKSFSREAYDQFRKIDITTTAKTFWALLKRPGMFVRGYLEGKRVGYLNPVKYFLYSYVFQLAVSVVVVWLFRDAEFQTADETSLRTQILNLLSTAFWGFFWWLFYRKSHLNVIENIVAALYFMAQIFYLSIAVKLILEPFADRNSIAFAAISLALQLGVFLWYSFFFAWRLFKEKPWKLVPKQLALSIIYAIVSIIVAFSDDYARKSVEQIAPGN